MQQTDVRQTRQTDVRQHHRLMSPPIRGGGIITEVLGIALCEQPLVSLENKLHSFILIKGFTVNAVNVHPSQHSRQCDQDAVESLHQDLSDTTVHKHIRHMTAFTTTHSGLKAL